MTHLPDDASPYSKYLNYCVDLAHRAGEVANRFAQGGQLDVEYKSDDSPFTIADTTTNEFITSALKDQFPEARIVAEEDVTDGTLPDSKPGVESGLVFFVDPIDGTKEFIKGDKDWCVLIGLADNGVPVMGVVRKATEGRTWYAVKGCGVFISDDPKTNPTDTTEPRPTVRPAHCRDVPRLSEARILASKSRHEERVMSAMADKCGDKVAVGSFGLKTSVIASGQADLYINFSCQFSFWDSCASVVVAEESGAIARRIVGGSDEEGSLTGGELKPITYAGHTTTHKGDWVFICAGSVYNEIVAELTTLGYIKKDN